MKNVILIHGYNGIPPVFKWLKTELNKREYKVIIPEFPVREGVKYLNWKNIFNQYKNNLNENSIVIAHSIGNEFFIKYMYENTINIKMYIGLAGFSKSFICEGKDDLTRALKEFLVSDEELNYFKNSVDKKYAIYSNDDHIVPFNILEDYVKTIKANPVYIEGIGHMGRKSNVEKIPEILEILKDDLYKE
ncbi:MAG: alpha/beta hydrolase [Clostridia bacterium]|nr:alpha/beta hydrolase [Clostridia bacterium]